MNEAINKGGLLETLKSLSEAGYDQVSISSRKDKNGSYFVLLFAVDEFGGTWSTRFSVAEVNASDGGDQ